MPAWAISSDPQEAATSQGAGIDLRRRSIDGTDATTVQTQGRSAATSGRRLKLVQFSAPPDDADLLALTRTGARIVHYIPHNAYLVWTASDSVARAARRLGSERASVRYYGDFNPQDALAPSLDDELSRSTPVAVTVQLYNHGPAVWQDVAQAKQLAERVLIEPAPVLDERYINVRLAVRGDRLAAITAMDAVVNLEPYVEPQLYDERQGQILAGNLVGPPLSPAGPGYLAWLADRGFSTDVSDYPVVVVVDDGVDNGTTSPVNSELRELNDSMAPSRLTFSITPPGAATTNPAGPDGHGNINASIIGGYNAASGAAVEDTAGFNYGLGISPYGRLANVRIFTPEFDVGAGDSTMVDDYYARGARVSSNSWGADIGGAYDSSSQEYDALTRDARSGVMGNQQLLFIFAAGNAGAGSNTTGSPATAKNVLTVGASETSNPNASAGDGCGLTGAGGNDARDIAGFSSRGPCDDGRIKPDIVAPGTFIQGAASQPSFNGSGVCGAASNDGVAPGTDALFPPGTAYTWSSGTSHSTPAVAGVASLIHELLPRVYGISAPSPALTKAYILHSGRHLTGSGANENLPGNSQGFGLVDMGLGFNTTAPRFFEDQTTVLSSSGTSATFSGGVADPSEPVRVALVWTDAPGSTVGNAYVNDLDLEVNIDGVLYRGNNFVLGVSQTGGSADPRNNAEAVFLPSGVSGPMSITVNAAAIVGDGIPGNGDTTDQDFALVAYNFTTVVSAGTIRLDQASYTCSDTIAISVSDSDLATTGTIAVALVSGDDDEVVTLTETPAGSGTFVGSISTEAAPSVAGNGSLEVVHGGIITATYDDADDGSGNPATAQDTAAVDCVAPVAADVATTDITGTQATITLSTDEPATVMIRYGTSCGSLTQSVPGEAATSHQIIIAGLSPLTPYYFAIDVVDAAGNLTTDDNGGSCYTFSTLDQADYFTELFTADNDLDNQTLTLTPDGSPDFYSACKTVALTFPTDPSGGNVLTLPDDGSTSVTIAGGPQVSLYGVSYSSFFVGSNGYITFGAGSGGMLESLAAHFSLPRIAALFDDLDPSAGGTVSWQQLADRVVVTFLNVPEFDVTNANSFQIEMFFDATIRITHLGIAASDGLAGLSEGLGLPGDFQGSNLDAFGPCSLGSMRLDRTSYRCSDSVSIEVIDGDLAGATTLAIALATSGGDAETKVLTEEPAASGIFIGSIITTGGTVINDNGSLDVADGQMITATYDDADDGTGNPATLQDTAGIDCLAPAVVGVTISDVASKRATIAFSTDEAAITQARYGTSCASLDHTLAASGAGTSHEIELSGLTPLTTYFAAVDATDGSGNASSDDNGGACYTFTTTEQYESFVELFSAADNDLAYQTLTLTPNASISGYSACRQSSTSFPTDPTSGTVLSLADDSFANITLSGGAQVFLYGVGYGSLYVGSNGYLTFGTGDTALQESLAVHYSLPRVAGLFDDLNPAEGGTISWKQLTDRVAVTYADVPQYGGDGGNSFQIEMFFDGTIRMTYLDIAANDGLVGVSAGLGTPSDFEESDLSAYDACPVACPSEPQTGCFAAARTSLTLKKDVLSSSRDQLQWKWSRGTTALTLADLGDPLNGSTGYRLCLYAQSGAESTLELASFIDAGGACSSRPCWRTLGSSGWKYHNKSGNGTGINKLVIKSGPAGKPSVQIAGKGALLTLPAAAGATAYFDPEAQIILQLQSSAGSSCWEARYPVIAARSNTATQFKAVTP